MDETLRWLDASGCAELVAAGHVRPSELVEAAIGRAERLNPALNAVITPLYERAAEAARALDGEAAPGPLAGVPMLLKDIGAVQRGQPQYRGTRLLRDLDWRSPGDTMVGARLRAAGLVALGKTNASELGLQPTTQPRAFGPTRNPWDLARSPGGSSGGSAAAVAAGIVPLAHGGDGGGSIRIPASWCGLVGLKPSRGRVPLPAGAPRYVTEHVLTRTVRDSAALLDALHGAVPGDQHALAPPATPFARAPHTLPERLRVGLVNEVPGVEVDPRSAAAATAAGLLLEDLGHKVEPSHPPALFTEPYFRDFRAYWAVGLVRALDDLAALCGRDLTAADVEPYTWAFAAEGRSLSGAAFLEIERRLQAWAMRVARWWGGGFDLLLSPATGCPPQPLEALEPDDRDPLAADRAFRRVWCFAAAFNLTGDPAISLPLEETEDGLPLGVQLVAPLGREDRLLGIAAQLEQARPWAARRPPAAAGSPGAGR